MKRFVNATTEDGQELSFRPYEDAIEFAEIALADDSFDQDVIDELDECIDFGNEEDRPDTIGYASEAKDIINHWRLGSN